MLFVSKNKLFPYLQLMRPANIVTSVADIFAGFALSGILITGIPLETFFSFALLIVATIGLYGGGIVFNDIFDFEQDKVERPERPLPSGKVKIRNALFLALVLFFIAVSAAFLVNSTAGFIAIGIALLAVFYNKVAKHRLYLGPFVMGTCRSGNLLLGMAAYPLAIGQFWYYALLPFFFIAGITFLSRGEVFGGGKNDIRASLSFFTLGFFYLMVLGMYFNKNFLYAVPYLLLFIGFLYFPLKNALKTGQAKDIRKAVKTGVLSVILMDAVIAAGFSEIIYPMFIVLLLPLSILFAKTFSVT